MDWDGVNIIPRDSVGFGKLETKGRKIETKHAYAIMQTLFLDILHAIELFRYNLELEKKSTRSESI